MTSQPKKRVLGLRDLKKAEVQYLMEEREGALQENPGVEEEEVLQRLSEAFRAMSYEDQVRENRCPGARGVISL